MIELKITIKSLDGASYSYTVEVSDDFPLMKYNSEFQKIVQSVIEKSKIEEIDCVKVRANFGEI